MFGMSWIVMKSLGIAMTVAEIACVLQGCGSADIAPTPAPAGPTSSPTPPPTPTPTTPQPTTPEPTTPTPTTPQPTKPKPLPTPAPTPLPTIPGKGVSDCKRSARSKQDEQFCDEFYDAQVGIAFSMISMGIWTLQGGGWGQMDNAKFNAEPPPHVESIEQAMSLVHHQKGSFPFPNSGSAYGLVLSVGPLSNFWQYFWTCSPGVLAADCKDRSVYPIPGSGKIPACKQPYLTAAETKLTYEQFRDQKNLIVSLTGTTDCSFNYPASYSEFDVNGLSSSAFAGILASNTTDLSDKTVPDDSTICKFLADRKLHRQNNQWPLWHYQPVPGEQRSELAVKRYIDCATTVVM